MSSSAQRWATPVVLANGETAYLRPMTPADAEALSSFHRRQPEENLYLRFFSAKPFLTDDELAHFTQVDFVDRVALVLERQGSFAAWASYERWPGRDDAEVAFMVDADEQHKGIATLLLEHLAVIARSNGIDRFTAEVLPNNQAMLNVFARAGWPVARRYDSGVVDVEFPLADTEGFRDTVESREQRADSRAMAHLLLPRTVAVIGASDRPGSVGAALWRAVSASGLTAVAVNPTRARLGSHRCWSAVSDAPGPIDLALVAVPPEALASTVEDCCRAGVRGAVVVSGADDTADMGALVAQARRFGLRLIGPASMGFTTAKGVAGTSSLNLSLADRVARPGVVAVSLQSGSLGASLLAQAEALELGLSWFVSLGDKADVSGNDLLQFWDDDDGTKVVALYTETFGNPRKFFRIARRVAHRRPIVTVRTGAAAATGAADALYAQAGLIQVPTVRDMLDTARVLATQPIPAGPRVAVLSTARSAEALTCAVARASGLTVVEPPRAVTWRSDAGRLVAALAEALADPANDAVILVFAPPLASTPPPVVDIERVATGASKPLLAVVLGQPDGPLQPGSTIPSFAFPEQAVAVLARMAAYRRWLGSSVSEMPTPVDDVDPEPVRRIIESAAGDRRQRLHWAECQIVLSCYGIDVASGSVVDADRVDAVLAAAHRIGYPVAVKATTGRTGVSAAAGTALDCSDDDAVRRALTLMAPGGPVLVQAMVAPGVDVRVHAVVDSALGATLGVGLGGRHADTIGDVVHRLVPLSLAAAREALAETRAGAALAEAGVGTDQLAQVMARVGQLLEDHPELRRVDLNPVLAGPTAATVTDATIELGPAKADPGALRRLQ